MDQKTMHDDALAGFKGIMSLVIVFFHTLPSTPLIDAIPLTSWVRYFGGNVGNSVFFMISGFLMARYHRNKLQSGSVSFWPYLLRKICKFYPLYLLTNLLAMILHAAKHGLSVITLEEVALTVLLQRGGLLTSGFPYNGPTWFVNALLGCNIAFFAICHFCKHRSSYLCALVGAIMWGYAAFFSPIELPVFHFRIGIGLMNYFMGCVLAEVYPLISQKTHRILCPTALLGLTGTCFLMLTCGIDNALGEMDTALALGLSPMLLYSVLANPLLNRPLRTAPLRFLGKLSISIYFWHMILYRFLADLLALNISTSSGMYLLYLILLLAGSWLSLRFLENGLFRNFGSQLVRQTAVK